MDLKYTAHPPRCGRKMSIFCVLGCIFAVFPRYFCNYMAFGLATLCWKTLSAYLEDTHSVFGACPQFVFGILTLQCFWVSPHGVSGLFTTKFWSGSPGEHNRLLLWLRLVFGSHAPVFPAVAASDLREENWALAEDSGVPERVPAIGLESLRQRNIWRKIMVWRFAESTDSVIV